MGYCHYYFMINRMRNIHVLPIIDPPLVNIMYVFGCVFPQKKKKVCIQVTSTPFLPPFHDGRTIFTKKGNVVTYCEPTVDLIQFTHAIGENRDFILKFLPRMNLNPGEVDF